MITDEQVWKMLDAWYLFFGLSHARTEAERNRDFAAMKRRLETFDADWRSRQDSNLRPPG